MYKTLLAGAAVAVLSFASAQAAPVALALSNFSGSDTLVDFNLASDATAVGALYSGSGVTFSGALLGMTNSGDTNLFPGNGGGVIASNWDYGRGAYTGLSFTASFSSMISRVGFYLENWPSQTATVELFQGATSLGTLSLAATAGLTAEFRGVGDASGFDKLVFTNDTAFNGFYAIDDVVFGGGVVPEPTTWALMIGGFGLAGAALRRRRTIAA